MAASGSAGLSASLAASLDVDLHDGPPTCDGRLSSSNERLLAAHDASGGGGAGDLAPMMRIYLQKIGSDEPASLEVQSHANLVDLKKAVCESCDVDSFVLLLDGAELELFPDEKVLSECGVKDGTTLTLIRKMSELEELIHILEDIEQKQDQMEDDMERLSKELLSHPLEFDEVYKRVMVFLPAYLSSEDERALPELLDRYEPPSDPSHMSEDEAKVMKLLTKMDKIDPMDRMDRPGPDSVVSDNAKAISANQLVEVQRLKFQELEVLAKQIKETPDFSTYDSGAVQAAAHAILLSKVEKKFGIIDKDIQEAEWLRRSELTKDREYMNLRDNIHRLLDILWHSPAPGVTC